MYYVGMTSSYYSKDNIIDGDDFGVVLHVRNILNGCFIVGLCPQLVLFWQRKICIDGHI